MSCWTGFLARPNRKELRIVKPEFANGGLITRPDETTGDTILTPLQHGYMLSASEVRELGGTAVLQAFQRFAAVTPDGHP